LRCFQCFACMTVSVAVLCLLLRISTLVSTSWGRKQNHYLRTHARMCVRMHARARTHTYTHTLSLTRTHHTYSLSHSLSHKHTLTHTHTHTDARRETAALARRHRTAFLVCPCCFLKHPHLRALAHASSATPALRPAANASLLPATATPAAAAAAVMESHGGARQRGRVRVRSQRQRGGGKCERGHLPLKLPRKP
jgi:hypothetical protein